MMVVVPVYNPFWWSFVRCFSFWIHFVTLFEICVAVNNSVMDPLRGWEPTNLFG